MGRIVLFGGHFACKSGLFLPFGGKISLIVPRNHLLCLNLANCAGKVFQSYVIFIFAMFFQCKNSLESYFSDLGNLINNFYA